MQHEGLASFDELEGREPGGRVPTCVAMPHQGAGCRLARDLRPGVALGQRIEVARGLHFHRMAGGISRPTVRRVIQ